MEKRITFACHGAGNGGAERVITTLANAFSQKGYSVQLITTQEPKNEYVIHKDIQRDIILSNKKNAAGRTIERVIGIRKCLKAFKPNAIISFSCVSNMQTIIASIGIGTKKIISERTDPNRYPESKFGKWARCVLYPLADKIVFQTEEAQDYFKKNIRAKSVIIPNPISPNLPEPFTGIRTKKIVGVGSLNEQKNWQMALKACEIFFAENDEYVFEIYGEGNQRNELQSLIDTSEHLSGRVFLRGFHKEAISFVRESMIYVSSSIYEGISNSMLEALAMGTPTICTDCPVGGARQFISNKQNGILVPVNDINALVEAFRLLSQDELLSKSLAKNSVSIREKLSLDRIVSMWEREISDDAK